MKPLIALIVAAAIVLVVALSKKAATGTPPIKPKEITPPSTECQVDSDCPDNFVCINGQCVSRVTRIVQGG